MYNNPYGIKFYGSYLSQMNTEGDVASIGVVLMQFETRFNQINR